MQELFLIYVVFLIILFYRGMKLAPAPSTIISGSGSRPLRRRSTLSTKAASRMAAPVTGSIWSGTSAKRLLSAKSMIEKLEFKSNCEVLKSIYIYYGVYRAFVPRHFAVVGKVARPRVLCAAIVEEDALNVLLGNSNIDQSARRAKTRGPDSQCDRWGPSGPVRSHGRRVGERGRTRRRARALSRSEVAGPEGMGGSSRSPRKII